jgi:hypothetical protein
MTWSIKIQAVCRHGSHPMNPDGALLTMFLVAIKVEEDQ